jgi:salicylate hydroxylase
VPLGQGAALRYGAPYWVIHRGDLQRVLLEAVRAQPDITLRLGTRCEDFVVHANGVSVACRQGVMAADEQGIALVCADGLWSELRNRFGSPVAPTFRHRTAWRALIPAERVPPALREPVVHLRLGWDAHLVHYPVKAGGEINVVAIVGDATERPGWSTEGAREDLLARFSRWRWSDEARALIALPERWLAFALYDLPPLRKWSRGPATLLGDAAHPTLPFLAQGAALAIEDAAVLASSFGQLPDDPAGAMRRYERARRRRTAKVQRAARRNGRVYHLAGAEALVRDLYLRALGGNRLLRRYDWLYDWKPLPPR